MNHKPYPKYKESGNEWLGELPENWDVKKITYLFKTISSGTTPKSDNPKFYESGIIPWVNTGDLNDSILDSCDKLVTELAIKEHSSLKQYEPGAIIFAMYGATIGKISILNFSATVNQACCVFADPQETITKFVFYWLFGFRKKIISLATGGGQPNISQDILRGLRLPYPTQQEQKSIATFLDRETSKLDILIREQKELITLLQEKRQALISNAVTKGLNPKAKMKDSGVEWLGEVPEHWEVKKLGRLCSRIGSGKTPSGGAEIYSDSGVIFLRSQNIHDEGMELSDVAFIDFAIDEEMAWSRVKAGDILINITGASIGRTCLVPDGFSRANVNQHVCTIRLMQQSARKFISIQLKSYYFKRLIEAIQDGGNRDSLNFDQISSFKVLIAPLSEMNVICDFLDRALDNLNSLIKEAEETIELMHEHRASLISEAVTGKIDVRKQA